MGSGKSTVGRALAEQLGRPFVDSDDVVEAHAGMTVRDVFAQHGEPTFRALERRALADLCGSPDPIVIGCGGGVVVDPENRRLLRGSGTVVLLTAAPATLVDRLEGAESRPLLSADPRATLERHAETRGPAYEAVADLTIATDGRRIDEVVDAILEALPGDRGRDDLDDGVAEVRRVRVALGMRSYDILIGSGGLRHVGDLLADRRRAAVVSQAAVADVHGDDLLASLTAADIEARLLLLDDGEEAKTLTTIERLARELADWGLLRSDVIVALGGGVVGDTAGFLAATYYRGVDLVQLPTTLLAQVDAAIGGKTAVNLPEGKNLIGVFHQPIAVICDIATLTSLPDREYRAGLGEVLKYALLGDEELRSLVETVPDELAARDPALLTEVVARCAAIKANVVELDELERSGRRATLNLGHTLGHALERAGGHSLLHGEAVAIGCVYAYELAARIGRVPEVEVARVRQLAERLDLPVTTEIGPASDLLAYMYRDKKAAGELTFVLPGPDGVTRVEVPESIAVDAMGAVGVRT
jgi:3-dehydroquinate synthase